MSSLPPSEGQGVGAAAISWEGRGACRQIWDEEIRRVSGASHTGIRWTAVCQSPKGLFNNSG